MDVTASVAPDPACRGAIVCIRPRAGRSAPHRLAAHGQRPPLAPAVGWSLVSGPQPPGEPGPHRSIEGAGIDCFQDPADGGLIRRLEPAGQRITPGPETGQDLRRRVRDPLTDGRERLRPREHRCHRCQ